MSSTKVGEGVPFRVPSRPAWRGAPPILSTQTATLREVIPGDARSLAATLGKSEVLQYLPVGPKSVEQFARFITWVRRERRAGRYLCFAVVPRGQQHAAGLFQLWPIEPGFGTAEIGFALDPSLWGTGTFIDCATAVVDFAFQTLATRRLECRVAVTNARGSSALVKLGGVQEGTLRNCFPCPAGVLDHTMWSILADEWRQRHGTLPPRVS
jgi:ribosomal-protein-alanine N-acetyltransferase